MGSALFGGSKTENKLPAWLEDSAKTMLDRSEAMGQTGYMPYAGAQVAALSPLQYAAMENTAGAANAFGMSTPQPGGDINSQTAPIDLGQFAEGDMRDKASRINDAYRSILGRDPDAEGFAYWMDNFNPDSFENNFRAGISNDATLDPLTGLAMPGMFNGVKGYSSLPHFTDAKAAFQQNAPGQYGYLNPNGSDPYAPNGSDLLIYGPHAGGGSYGGAGNSAAPGSSYSGGGFFGGYTGLGDMTDGGGPGQSGSSFGGALGGVSNGMGMSPGGGIFGGLW
jgi:hypothetical protein